MKFNGQSVLKSHSTQKSKILVWAVDPTQNPNEAKKLAKVLRIWAKHLDCKVLPVSVVSKTWMTFPYEALTPWTDKTEEFARESVNRYLKQTGTADFLRPELIVVQSKSNREMAPILVKFAQKKKALMIFTNTRAKKGMNPFRLGGFAETLIVTSKVPVLLFNSSSRAAMRTPSILFPTDFGHASHNALTHLALWADTLKAPIVLYNQVETPMFFPQESEGTWEPRTLTDEAAVKTLERQRMKKGQSWQEELRLQDVKASVLIKCQRHNLSADIVMIADSENVSMIAMASRRSPVAQTLLGGVARDVLLLAQCPALIFYRPKVAQLGASAKFKASQIKKQCIEHRTFAREVRHS